MPIAALCVRQRGTTQYSAVFRMGGASMLQVGNNFTVMTLTSATGTAQPGDTLTGGTSGATAVVRSVITAGATLKLFLNNIVGVFTNENVTTTAGSGNAAGTLSTANIGILEPSTDSGYNTAQSRVLSYKGSVYCAINTYILKYDGTANWSIAYTLTPSLSAAGAACHTGLHVFDPFGSPFMGIVWGDAAMNAIYRATSADGTTWSAFQLATGYGMKANGGGAGGGPPTRELVQKDVLYFLAAFTDTTPAHAEWNSGTDTFARPAFASTMGGSLNGARDLLVLDNLVCQIVADNSSGRQAMWRYAGGSYTKLTEFADTGNLQGGGFGQRTTGPTFFAPGDGFVYVIYYAFTNPNLGWVVKKVNPSTWADLGQLQATVFAGTGVAPLYPGAFTNELGRWVVVVDNVTNPLTPDTYLYWIPTDVPGSALIVLKWNGPAAACTVVGSGGDTGLSLPHTRVGGGERIWTPGQPDIIIDTGARTPGGVLLTFRVFGGGTRSVAFFLTQNGEIPDDLQATLSAPSAGVLNVNGKQIDNVPADGTSKTVKWVAGPAGDNVTNLVDSMVQPTVLS